MLAQQPVEPRSLDRRALKVKWLRKELNLDNGGGLLLGKRPAQATPGPTEGLREQRSASSEPWGRLLASTLGWEGKVDQEEVVGLR